MGNWDKPRIELLEIVVGVARRGYDVARVAESVAMRHYLGKSAGQAAALLGTARRADGGAGGTGRRARSDESGAAG